LRIRFGNSFSGGCVSTAYLKHAVSLRAAFSSEILSSWREKKFGKPPQRQSTLRFCFVQIVKRIFQRHPPDAAESRLLAKLANFRFMKTERAESGAFVREGCRHAVKHAYAVKHRAERIRVFLELVRAVDVETVINAARPKRATNRLQQLKWINRVMHHIESGDHIKSRRQSFRNIAF